MALSQKAAMALSQEEVDGVNMRNRSRALMRTVDCINMIYSLNRSHTLRELRSMSEYDYSLALWRRIEILDEERDGIISGSIEPWSGTTKPKMLRSCRRRLQRAKFVANELGIQLIG